ncbi:DNA-binding protein [Burkholderia sp. MSHR3999]|uniref:DNA-binding protein n=1 Tax=Burkholderia sp. MSHR3999 TaxID=1542965 RepID=UPI0009E36F90|nr:DNA-binding protein [Burkholderia sp. MSHR3999]
MEEIGFKSAYDAVRFALAYSSQQYGETLMAKRLRGESKGGGMGLIGMDGAGQAGQIRREMVESLSVVQLAAIVARTAPRDHPCACGRPCCSGRIPNAEWQEAISFLTEASAAYASGFSHYRARRAIIEKIYGVKIDLGEIAEQCDAHRNTVGRHHSAVRRWLEGDRKRGEPGLERNAWTILDVRASEIGICGTTDEKC